MRENGFILISIIAATLFLVFLTVTMGFYLSRSTSLVTLNQDGSDNDGPVKITDPINMANSVAIQADLKSIQVGIEIYNSEFGKYPNSLQELRSGGYLNEGLNISSYNYQLCDSSGSKALLYKNSTPYQGIVLDFDGSQSVSGDSPPTCG